MTIDTAAILAARYQKDPSPLKAAVLGQGDSSINPYAALRALQLQKEAERYQMAQAAMRGEQYQNQPSMVEQALSPTAPQMPPQMPQGLPAMQQGQQMPPQQPSPGLEGMPMPEGSDEEYAGGGIVAFADEGLVEDDQLTPDMLADLQENQDKNTAGDPNSHQSIAARLPGLLQRMENMQYQEFKPEDYRAAFTQRRALLEEGAEPSPYGALKEQIAGLEADRAQGLKQASGLAMLAAASDVMQPGGALRGLASAGRTYAGIYGQALQADKAEKRALMSMQFNLADAQRKERMGLNREAIAAADQARQDHLAAQKFGMDKVKNMGLLASNMARATRPPAGKDTTPKNFDAVRADFIAAEKYRNSKLPEDQRLPDELVVEKATKEATDYWGRISGTGALKVKETEADIRGKSQAEKERDDRERRKQEQQRIDIERDKLEQEKKQRKINYDKSLNEWQQTETARKKQLAEEKKGLKFNRDYIRGDAETKKRMEKEIDDKYPPIPKPVWEESAAPAPAPAPAPAKDGGGNKKSSLTGKAATIKGAPEGSKYGNQLPDGRYEVLDASGKLIGYAK